MNQISNKLLLGTCLVLLVGLGYFCYSRSTAVPTVQQVQVADTRTPTDKLLEENCDCKKNKTDCSHAAYDSCLNTMLVKTVAEREWKYTKLVSIQNPQVNTYDFTPALDSFTGNLKSWHKDLVATRDQWCTTALSAWSNNGVDTLTNECRLDYELRAVSLLNNLYYKGVMQDTQGSKGISDFETKSVSKQN